MVYDKTVRVSEVKQGLSHNLLNVDPENVSNAAWFLHRYWVIPVKYFCNISSLGLIPSLSIALLFLNISSPSLLSLSIALLFLNLSLFRPHSSTRTRTCSQVLSVRSVLCLGGASMCGVCCASILHQFICHTYGICGVGQPPSDYCTCGWAGAPSLLLHAPHCWVL